MSRILLSLTLLGLVGCGGGLGTVPVSGTVTVDGNPMEGVIIQFLPDDPSGMAASGTTDGSGAFKLTTEINGDGALPGSYKVTVSKFEVKDDGVPENLDMESEEDMDAAYGALDNMGEETKPTEDKSLIAAKFAAAATSGLTATVTEEGNEGLTFEVTSK